MYVTAWRFVVSPANAAEFESHYRAGGTWSSLFRASAAYVRTELLRNVDRPTEYMTLDYWQSRDAYEQFRATHAEEYRALDEQTGTLTDAEEHLGEIGR